MVVRRCSHPAPTREAIRSSDALIRLISGLVTGKSGSIDVLELGSPVGWDLSVPPGVPKARVAALQGAFDKMLVDKAFIKDAYAKHSMVDGASGEFVQNAVNKALAADPRLVRKLRALAGFK